MALIDEVVNFNGVLTREEFPNNNGAKLKDYKVEVLQHDTIYDVERELPHDFIIQNVFYRIGEAFEGTLNLGNDANPGRIIQDADFVKSVGKRSVAKSIMYERGKHIRLYVGPSNTGTMVLHVTGFMLDEGMLGLKA